MINHKKGNGKMYFFTQTAIGLCWVTFFCLPPATAQFTIDHSNYQKGKGFVTDVRGRRYEANPYERVTSGSPWWREGWCPADLADVNGRVYQNIAIKIDLVADKVYYFDSSGTEMELLTPLLLINAYPPATADTLRLVRADYFTPDAQQAVTGWMQLYISGEATLLQQLDKKMNETQGFSSAVAERTIVGQNTWVLALGKEVFLIKKLKELQELLAARKPAIRQYACRQKGLDAQVQELVTAFNALYKGPLALL